jgi:hypothetical protein
MNLDARGLMATLSRIAVVPCLLALQHVMVLLLEQLESQMDEPLL